MKIYQIGLMALGMFVFDGCTAEEIAYFNQTMNNVANQMRQNAYGTEQATYQLQQLNNEMYQRRQDRRNNMRMQQLNNSLYRMRYGY